MNIERQIEFDKDYLARGKIYGNSLAYYDENLDLLSELREEICSKIRNGAVDDLASKKLKQIREQIIKCEEQMKQKAEQILRSNKEYMADNYCTFRNGRKPEKASRYAKKIYRCCDRVRGIEYGG